MKPRHMVIAFFAALCLRAGPAWGLSIVRVPMAAMIAGADAVALTRIDELAVYPRDPSVPYTHTVTLTVTDAWRGRAPKALRAHVHITRDLNPSAAEGVEALVFLGEAMPRDGAPKDGPPGLYGGFQSFLVTKDLVPGGSPKDQAAALAATKQAVAAYRGGGAAGTTTKPSIWEPVLTDEAATPFLKLLASDSAPLRHWAVTRALDSVHLTPLVGREFLAALDHKDGIVRSKVAEVLMARQYAPARTRLERLAAELPDGAFRDRVRKYLASRQIADYLGRVPDETAKPLVASLTQNKHLGVGNSYSIEVHAAADGKLDVSPFYGPLAGVAAEVRKYLQQADLSKSGALPLEFRLYLWADEGKLRFELREQHL